MSNSNTTYWPLLVLIVVSSCTASRYEFNTREFATGLSKEIAQLAGSKDSAKVLKIRVYRADIAEKLVEQNNVSEYKLLNRYSEKDTIPILVSRYKHQIYLFSFETEDEDKYAMLVTATYDGTNNCIGLGGAYAGVFRNRFNDSGFATSYALKIKTSNEKPRKVKRVVRGPVYQLDFFADGPIESRSTVRFYQVIQRTNNKISGLGKELVYTTSQVFNDPNALVFAFVEEFKL